MADSNETGKATFLLRCEFFAQVKMLTREQRGDLLTALFAYASGEELPPMDGVTGMCFEFIRASVDAYTVKYEARCQKNRENGKRGGRPPKKANESDDNRLQAEKSDSGADEATESEKTERFSEDATESEKTERVKNNRDSDSDSDSDSELDLSSNIATHTRRDKPEGGVGETNGPRMQEAVRLIAWVEAYHPSVQRMPEPLDAAQIAGLLRKYDSSDLRRLIAELDNKRKPDTNRSAYTTLTGFIRHDRTLKSLQPQKFTWDDVLAYIDRHPGTTTEAFIRQQIDGRAYWLRKADMQTPQPVQP